MKNKPPTLQVLITEENYKQAVRASSGSCLIADAIKQQYPKLSNVDVDVATVRVTDRKRGERYIYLTPRSAGELVLAFDQGWPEESFPKKIVIRQPVRIVPIEYSRAMRVKVQEQRQLRFAELEAKQQRGESLTPVEQRSLEKLHKPWSPPENRPIAPGPAEIENPEARQPTVRGGRHVPSPSNPNLLRGRNRLFGAKTAKPSEVFERAVKQAVKADRAKRKKKASK